MNFQNWNQIEPGFFIIDTKKSVNSTQTLTNDVFSEKWKIYSEEKITEQEKNFEFQRQWFLDLYGFQDENHLAKHLQSFEYILDAGCGLGYKTAWFATLAPKSKVIGVDFSSASYTAYQRYKDEFSNLIFAKGDIANTLLPTGSIGFTVCDQVIMHTDCPSRTLSELSRITSDEGQVCCYWYRKKALPRELLDDYFRKNTSQLTSEELWKLSKEVLKLGRMLSDLKVEANFPDLPSLGIIGGKMDLQRFIYWNFIKCFWNEELGYSTSLSTNFDWYSPVNAKRFSEFEIKDDLESARLQNIFWHEEEACFSGRFSKKK
jgi:ubiquinone/menaquinone biosynthesis C-methylase UbiE